MASPVRAVHVALSWLTVLPLPQPSGPMDRDTGAAVMTAVPVVGVVLGAGAVGIAAGLDHTALPATLIGFLTVIALALATRGMHLDGLADTADGLGCYGPPERVAAVMRSGAVGPFGVATVVAVMVVDGLAVGALVAENRWYEIAFAVALGRLVAVIGTRSALPPAHGDGFGALVAGTQRTSVAVWTIVALLGTVPLGWAGGGLLVASRVAQGVAVVGAVVVIGWFVTRHCARRMAGISGDVLGAGIELGVAGALVGLLL